ncbi:MAG: prepilin-type N-terminal cleavage/methylation domain-containing protein [Acidovorax sp.]|uniref:PulJ/GspJ family protein n=1 Tax=Acidovorax sp. TaxID=1872122 RepID=UPI0039E533FD
MRAGGRRQRGGAALARRLLAWAAPVACAARRFLPPLPRAGEGWGEGRRKSRQRGFTLIELLVAIGVMALIALLSWRGLDGMARAQETTRQRADEMLVLQAALAQWGADLDALMPITHTTPLDWDGQVLRLTRRTSAVPDDGALVVAWTRRGLQGAGQWVRWQSPPVRTLAEWQQAWQRAAQWAQNPGDAERRHETALLPLTEWQIFYYRGGAWSNPLSSTGTTTQTGTTATVPDGVRLQITLPPGQALAGKLTRDWVNPLLGGGRS